MNLMLLIEKPLSMDYLFIRNKLFNYSNSLYGKIDANEIAPIDILSVNTFFLVMWLLAQASIWNFLFLRRALPLTKEELGEEEPELSRTSKGNVSNQSKVHFKQLQDKTSEYARKTRRSVDLEKSDQNVINLKINSKCI